MKTEKRDSCKGAHILRVWYVVHPVGGGNGEDRQYTACREHNPAIMKALRDEFGDRFQPIRIDDCAPRQT